MFKMTLSNTILEQLLSVIFREFTQPVKLSTAMSHKVTMSFPLLDYPRLSTHNGGHLLYAPRSHVSVPDLEYKYDFKVQTKSNVALTSHDLVFGKLGWWKWEILRKLPNIAGRRPVLLHGQTSFSEILKIFRVKR
jgi:hypothetical protein